MIIIGRKQLSQFAARNALARNPITRWIAVTTAASWHSLVDIRKHFPSASYVQPAYYVFNIHGNDFRLITDIDFTAQTVTILNAMTHERYDDWRP